MKKFLKFILPLILILSVYTYSADDASASTSEPVFVGSSNTYGYSNLINASSKVYVLIKNHGSVDIYWTILDANNKPESDTLIVRPGGAVGKFVTTNSNTKHKLALYCSGDTNKCSATGNISLN
ncbi:hypothetical protein [Lysinibacillus sp. ZYM-1]|uniref:hypothetical protein n=1 Tax=Lysinibacillus sp. ZYM-1 TaxID=1681184 RepID=UPI0006CE7510|nr:hypothetical protein [Lysinibacillus sp. ZYM-1]KPN97384.1 hypothetical protein AO843_14110 [Lysinibacillus sp. ZYM-1]